MKSESLNRRTFFKHSAALAGGAVLLPLAAPSSTARAAAVKRTAADQVALGRTGIRLSRLGLGTGSNSGKVQRDLGRQAFDRLIRYAYDKGITYIDAAQSYQTFGWIGAAIKGLPRERLFIQSKIPGEPEDVLDAIDKHRKAFDTDYIDSMLIHCMVKPGWTDPFKRVMEGFDQAREKKWIRARGVSCHSLPALQTATASDWTDVHLVRLNPQGASMDTPEETWNARSDASHVPAVVSEIKEMRRRGHGVIGMKLIGDGAFQTPEEREKSIGYVIRSGLCDSVVIGFKSTSEIDEAIERIDRALAEV
ncbi:MAG TPA: aldo/keto reductase [Verrucomicrobiota bacterium]|nr:aldo/keto reductase [Verrucomicrobiota bacterium]HRZ38720.1 aldo/keto reductase [Candidatus Paceibacterota bacterium]HRZ57983.1 aldo/keto reductase [Candidatus Paceibacterota bacterium]